MRPSLDQFALDQRCALITGSSRGIGLAMAHALGGAGATIAVNGRDARSVAAAVAQLGAAGIAATAAVFDVCDEQAVADAIDAIERNVGPIDILVNNAGIQRRNHIADYSSEDFRALVDTNLVGAFTVSKAVAARMMGRGRGKIINTCSVQSFAARGTTAPYAATKGALKLLTQGMCADLARHGIQVNGIAPGYFDTELNAALVADTEFSAWVERRTPAGRWGQLPELGGVAVFLASDASSFVNGHVVVVDGGMTAVL